MPQPNPRKPTPQINGWNEYKRLVLAELERLNQAVERLREKDEDTFREITELNESCKAALIGQFDSLFKQHEAASLQLCEASAHERQELKDEIVRLERKLKDEIVRLEKKFEVFKDGSHASEIKSSGWGFWTAIATLGLTFIISIISLIATLYGHSLTP